MAECDPNATYRFTSDSGEQFVETCDNPYVKESIETGLPINISESGRWYIYPFVDVEDGHFTAHIPSWFKKTMEYEDWNNKYVPLVNETSIDDEWSLFYISGILEKLGKRAAEKIEATNSNVKKQENEEKTIQQTNEDFFTVLNKNNIIVPGLTIIIISSVIAILFSRAVKNSIKNRKEFSGIVWGILNSLIGIGGIGILFTAIAYKAIKDESKKVRSKGYSKYIERQMGDFLNTYIICFMLVGIVVIITLSILNSNK